MSLLFFVFYCMLACQIGFGGEPKAWILQIHPHEEIYLTFTMHEAENALVMMQKIEAVCLEHDGVMHELAEVTTVSYCVDYVRSLFIDFIVQRSNPELDSNGFIGTASTLNFMSGYEMRSGAYDFLYFPDAMRTVQFSDSQYVWRTSVALLVPLSCDANIKSIDDLPLLNMLLPSVKYTLRDEMRYWATLSLYIALPVDCQLTDGTSLTPQSLAAHIRLLDIPFEDIVIKEGSWHSMLIQYDMLIADAYAHGLQFFVLLQSHLLFGEPNWLWNSIIPLTRSDVLPWDKGFGCVTMHAPTACKDHSGAKCPMGLVLSRSHVDIFLPQESISLRSNTPVSFFVAVIKITEIYKAFNLATFDIMCLVDISRDYPYLPVPEPRDTNSINREYPIEVFVCRHQVAAWLYSYSPFAQSLIYADANLLYKKNDIFFDIYHQHGQILAGSENDPAVGEYVQPSAAEIIEAKVAVITAIFGGYEAKLQRFARQSVPTDFICFTDMEGEVDGNGWIVDRTPYHLSGFQDSIDSGDFVNSIRTNKHPMNIGKFYKQYFFTIPRMKKYETVIWVDGNLQLERQDMVSSVQSILSAGHNLILFEHWRNGSLKKEVEVASGQDKYRSTMFNNIAQPLQDIPRQYETYMLSGYDELYWKRARPNRPQYGVWITSFIGFDMRNPETEGFLTSWYMQTVIFSTQDQVGFSFAAQMTGVFPYSLPDRVHVNGTAIVNTLYRKCEHGLK